MDNPWLSNSSRSRAGQRLGSADLTASSACRRLLPRFMTGKSGMNDDRRPRLLRERVRPSPPPRSIDSSRIAVATRAARTLPVLLFVVTVLHNVSAGTDAERRGKQAPVATSVRVERAARGPGLLYASIGDKEEKIADRALGAWIIDGGRRIVYSGTDGAGGYENEGQSLRVYDIRTGRRKKILAEYFVI